MFWDATFLSRPPRYRRNWQMRKSGQMWICLSHHANLLLLLHGGRWISDPGYTLCIDWDLLLTSELTNYSLLISTVPCVHQPTENVLHAGWQEKVDRTRYIPRWAVLLMAGSQTRAFFAQTAVDHNFWIQLCWLQSACNHLMSSCTTLLDRSRWVPPK